MGLSNDIKRFDFCPQRVNFRASKQNELYSSIIGTIFSIPLILLTTYFLSMKAIDLVTNGAF